MRVHGTGRIELDITGPCLAKVDAAGAQIAEEHLLAEVATSMLVIGSQKLLEMAEPDQVRKLFEQALEVAERFNAGTLNAAKA